MINLCMYIPCVFACIHIQTNPHIKAHTAVALSAHALPPTNANRKIADFSLLYMHIVVVVVYVCNIFFWAILNEAKTKVSKIYNNYNNNKKSASCCASLPPT